MEYFLENDEWIIEEQHSFAVFTMDATQRRWWQPFLCKPFYHVLIINACVANGGRHFINIVDPVISFKKWRVRPRYEAFEVSHWYSYMTKYRELCMKNSGGFAPKAVKIKINLDKYNYIHHILNKIPLCTTYVARMFGIATYAITPLQLYKALKSKGCSNLF